MKRLLFYFFLILALSSCVTSNILLDVQRPADITVSQDIQNVVVINRSRPSEENLAGNIIEGIISGEGIGYDREGADYCVEGLSDILLNSDRYILKNTRGMELKGTGTANFPPPLDKNIVKDICASYDADALLVLETFDSDSRIQLGKPFTRNKKVKGKKVKELRYPATLIMEIQSGWRIYEAQNQTIVDENRFLEVKEFKSYGVSSDQAIRRLPSKSIAIKESGIFAGRKYGKRISPTWVKVNRAYFIGKNESLKLAHSHVKNKDWDSAIKIWKDLLDNPDQKTSRRSAYNMAVASEFKGGLDIAIEWAIKSQKLGEKKASRYINLLHIRKKNKKKLKQQLNN